MYIRDIIIYPSDHQETRLDETFLTPTEADLVQKAITGNRGHEIHPLVDSLWRRSIVLNHPELQATQLKIVGAVGTSTANTWTNPGAVTTRKLQPASEVLWNGDEDAQSRLYFDLDQDSRLRVRYPVGLPVCGMKTEESAARQVAVEILKEVELRSNYGSYIAPELLAVGTINPDAVTNLRFHVYKTPATTSLSEYIRKIYYLSDATGEVSIQAQDKLDDVSFQVGRFLRTLHLDFHTAYMNLIPSNIHMHAEGITTSGFGFFKPLPRLVPGGVAIAQKNWLYRSLDLFNYIQPLYQFIQQVHVEINPTSFVRSLLGGYAGSSNIPKSHTIASERVATFVLDAVDESELHGLVEIVKQIR